MGGGKVTRPDFGLGRPDPGHPMTEFYLLLQGELARAESFALPGLYARFEPPAYRIYAEEAADWCAVASGPREGYARLLEPGRLRLHSSELLCGRGGVPSALLLSREGSSAVCALRLLPPVRWPAGEEIPPWPESAEALTLRLDAAALELADADPAALARQLIAGTAGKAWVRHPALDRYIAKQLERWQKLWRSY